jgi:hypothetical protein
MAIALGFHTFPANADDAPNHYDFSVFDSCGLSYLPCTQGKKLEMPLGVG